MKKIIFLFFLALTTIISCQKPKDEILPEISIELKSVNQTEIILLVSAPSASQVEMCRDLNRCVTRRVINGSAEFTFSNLASNTSYSFQATAFYSNYEVKSELIEVSTKPLAIALKAEQIELHSALLKAEIYNPDNLEYYFVYGKAASSLEFKTAKSSGQGIVSALVQNLSVGQDYFYRIVLDIDSELFPSDIISFRTLGKKPEIRNVKVIYGDTLTMEVTCLLKSNLLLSEVKLKYFSEISQMITLDPITVNTDTNWTPLSFIVPIKTGTIYRLILEAQNEIGLSVVDTNANSPAFIYDDRLYHFVKIGDYKWTTSDFRGKHYLNGDPIPYIAEDTLWATTSSGAMCYWGNDEQNYIDYGALYNFFVIEDERGIAPPGWKIPEEDEHYNLVRSVRIMDLRDDNLDYWLGSSTATNSTGFSARGGGIRGGWPNISLFQSLEEVAYFHVNQSYAGLGAVFVIIYDNRTVFAYNNKGYGQSIRFIAK